MFLVLRLLKRVKVCALMQCLRAVITAWGGLLEEEFGWSEGDTVLLPLCVALCVPQLVEMGSAEVNASHQLPG